MNKTIFLENLLGFLFSERIFKYFFFKKTNLSYKKVLFFKNVFLKKLKKKNIFLKKTKIKTSLKKKDVGLHTNSNLYKYNFTKVWLVKYNNYILLTTFVYFYFKIKNTKNVNKKKQKAKTLPKLQTLFWRKKRGLNKKRQKINFNINLVF